MSTVTAEKNSDDLMLEETLRQRAMIANTLLAKGVPEDPAVAKVALAALDGIDKQILGRKRLVIDENQGKAADAIAASMIATMFTKAQQLRPYLVEEGVIRETPVLGADIPEPTLVEGETATSAPQQDFESFTARTSNLEV